MKYYYIIAEIEEGYPSYTFVIKAETMQDADILARKVLKTDYPEAWSWRDGGIDYTIRETTAEKLLEHLTLN